MEDIVQQAGDHAHKAVSWSMWLHACIWQINRWCSQGCLCQSVTCGSVEQCDSPRTKRWGQAETYAIRRGCESRHQNMLLLSHEIRLGRAAAPVLGAGLHSAPQTSQIATIDSIRNIHFSASNSAKWHSYIYSSIMAQATNKAHVDTPLDACAARLVLGWLLGKVLWIRLRRALINVSIENGPISTTSVEFDTFCHNNIGHKILTSSSYSQHPK